ncbi:aldehyde dehydrogenase family protein [Microbacterium sp. NPDC019599]|uniref:aldehyde dehydrogenase family protein n=1 Tax=Microbacterium sp. NPDC019599 TaxID=3154690 RepID=UPI0033EFBE0E
MVDSDVYTPTVGGRGVETDETFDVVDPSRGEPFAQAPEAGIPQLDEAVRSAVGAFSTWRRDEAARVTAMRAAADVIEANVDTLAPLLTREQGMPLAAARAEVASGAHCLRWAAGLEVPRELVRDDGSGYAEVFRRPLGPVAAITPWNYPVTLSFWKIAPALRAGNTVVLKPSPFTPLTLLEIGRLLRGILPDGVLNVVSGTNGLGEALVAHPAIRKVSFTGATATGREVGAAAAHDLKRMTLELGGNDPAIVFDDVDVAASAPLLFWSSFTNSGQVCLAAKRVYVQGGVYDEVVEAVSEYARTVVMGDGLEEGTQLGPLTTRSQFDRVSELVDEALARGARAAAGGAPLERPGHFFAPTVLADADDGMRVVDEEQFGPVMPIVRFSDADEAIARANSSEFGLTASVWSADRDRALAVAAELECGQVGIGMHGLALQPDLPFGGFKASGVGVENGLWGYYEYTQTQAIAAPPA